MLLLLLILQAHLTVPPPAPPPPAPGRGNLASLVSADDYPAEAVANGWEGTVSIRLLVSKTGLPIWCLVAQSSGHTVLDTKTCEVFMARARFTPAKGIHGQPVDDVFEQRVHWALEKETEAEPGETQEPPE